MTEDQPHVDRDAVAEGGVVAEADLALRGLENQPMRLVHKKTDSGDDPCFGFNVRRSPFVLHLLVGDAAEINDAEDEVIWIVGGGQGLRWRHADFAAGGGLHFEEVIRELEVMGPRLDGRNVVHEDVAIVTVID